MKYQANPEVFCRYSMKVSPKLRLAGVMENELVDLVKYALVRNSGVAGDVDTTKDDS
jgi:ABC-type taurine transport system substrate-binding protein